MNMLGALLLGLVVIPMGLAFLLEPMIGQYAGWIGAASAITSVILIIVYKDKLKDVD